MAPARITWYTIIDKFFVLMIWVKRHTKYRRSLHGVGGKLLLETWRWTWTKESFPTGRALVGNSSSSSSVFAVGCRMIHQSGQIRIFHQPRFPWNKGISLTKPRFGVRLCEVAIIWPDQWILWVVSIYLLISWDITSESKIEVLLNCI